MSVSEAVQKVEKGYRGTALERMDSGLAGTTFEPLGQRLKLTGVFCCREEGC
jgi:hypothetical protein